MRLPSVLFLLIFLWTPGLVRGQGEDFQLEGGSFEWQGKVIEVSAAEMQYHAEIVSRFNPKTDAAGLVELAWGRAIRLESAGKAGLKVDEEKFQKWMQARHAEVLSAMKASELTPKQMAAIWLTYVKQRGFADNKEYEKACREEYLAEKFIELEFPVSEANDTLLRERFRDMHTAYSVKALVFAPETLDEPAVLSPDNEDDRKLFASWWQSLSENDRRSLDDLERPAAQADALYFQFSNKSMAELKEEFEQKRPGLETSFADATKGLEMSDIEKQKMLNRWTIYRRSTMKHINGELPAGLDDLESFELVKDHLIREWKIIRLLGDVWEELRHLPAPADVHGAALRHGFQFRHVPLQAAHRIQADVDGRGALAGDHPLGFRRTRIGEIFDYNTNPQVEDKVYYVNGVVDQPGMHASIWRLDRFEGQRLLTTEEAMAVAWDRFVEANNYRLALSIASNFALTLEAQVRAEMAAMDLKEDADVKQIEREVAARLFGDFFDKDKALVKQSKVLGPFVVRPFEEITGLVRARGTIEQRTYDCVLRDWHQTVGPLGTQFDVGQVIPLAKSNERQLALMLRIEAIHPPKESQFDLDPSGRRRAEASLETTARSTRTTASLTVYRYPRIVQNFKLKAPQLDKLMSERFIKTKPEKSEPEKTKPK